MADGKEADVLVVVRVLDLDVRAVHGLHGEFHVALFIVVEVAVVSCSARTYRHTDRVCYT